MSVPPPLGMSEVDYEAIEAAVTETVRGRWFLNEFARRNRLAETRLLLDAMARLEATVAAGQPSLPSSDPSIRLLIQRIKEIAGQLDGVARDMRDDGIEERHWTAVDHHARAVAGLMRSATPARQFPPPIEAKAELGADFKAANPKTTGGAPPVARLPAAVPSAYTASPRQEMASSAASADPRLAVLSGLDSLTLAKKLALFS